MRDVSALDIDRLQSNADEADAVFEIEEDTFREFYDRTARALWVYLARIAGEPQVADDLLQEAYYRFLRARVVFESEAHRRNYLFRIATNLVRDGRRRRSSRPEVASHDADDVPGDVSLAVRTESRVDVRSAMARLKPRERELLWLAYACGSSHREIGETLGIRTMSIKPLLFRARHRLAALLRGSGYSGGRRA